MSFAFERVAAVVVWRCTCPLGPVVFGRVCEGAVRLVGDTSRCTQCFPPLETCSTGSTAGVVVKAHGHAGWSSIRRPPPQFICFPTPIIPCCLCHIAVVLWLFAWQWFVAAAAPDLITELCDQPFNPLWGKVTTCLCFFVCYFASCSIESHFFSFARVVLVFVADDLFRNAQPYPNLGSIDKQR